MSAPLTFISPTTGRVAHMGYRFQDSAGAYIGSRITSGITEAAGNNGVYIAASPTTPATAWAVEWSDDTITTLVGTQAFDFIGNVNPFSTGTGPKSVTLHFVDDSAVALGGVSVTVQDPNDITAASGVSDGSGNLVVNLLASTQYTINNFKSGYTSAPSVQTTGAGNGAQTLTTIVLTQNVPPTPPVDPTLQTVYGTLYGLNGAAENAIVKFTLVPQNQNRPLTANGNVITFQTATATTDSSGFFTIDLPRSDLMDDPAFYNILCTEAQIDLEGVTLGAAPVDISDL